MGCTQSTIDNVEVARCKDRRQFMRDAVSARNAFAAAHSAYAMSLKNTGAALSDYVHGKVENPHMASPSGASLSAVAQSQYDTLPPPPPPLPNYPASPIQRAASMPHISIHKPEALHSDSIIEEEEEDDEEEIENESHRLRHRSGGGIGSRSGVAPQPSPPRTPTDTDGAATPPFLDSDGMNSDYYTFSPMEDVLGPSLAEVDEGRIERAEIGRRVFEERSKRAEGVDDSDGGAHSAEMEENATELPSQPPPATKAVKKVKQVAPAEGKRGGKVATSVNLFQIFSDIDDCFLRASESAHEVSKMLEANRLHYHSNFADNQGHIDHSARVLRLITWNKSLNNANDVMEDFDSEEHEMHATVLDKMLAWEKKLYDEVKTGEQMKHEYQRNVALLSKLKTHGSRTEALEKRKAIVRHLHTRYIVDMQSMDSAVSEINRLRDEQLYRKLVSLVDGMATMWETLQIHHENQSKIVTALRSLDISQSPKETSKHHHERTVQLWVVVQEWNSHFEKLVTHQKEYIRALNNWLKLNLIPIDNHLKERISTPLTSRGPQVKALLHAWQDFLEKLPDELARTAICNFAVIVHTIVECQVVEMKLRYQCEDTRKELTRKTRRFEDWYNKYMERRTPPDEMDPERALDKDLITERLSAVEIVKKKLEEDEEAHQRQCIQVREESLASLKTGLPELFGAMWNFSLAASDMYRNLRSISQPHKQQD